MEDSVKVYPTLVGATHHLGNTSAFSTIGKERASNGALKAKTKDEFFKYMTEDWPPKPLDYQNIVRINLSGNVISGLISDRELQEYFASQQVVLFLPR